MCKFVQSLCFWPFNRYSCMAMRHMQLYYGDRIYWHSPQTIQNRTPIHLHLFKLFLVMICFAVLCRWLNALSLSEVKLITLYYCQSMLVFNWLLAKMVEYVGKRLLFLGLFIYIRCYTFHGTVKGFGSRCLNHTIML